MTFRYCVDLVIGRGWITFISFPLRSCIFSLSLSQSTKKCWMTFHFSQLIHNTVALKGENVSFEPVFAGERWLTLMQNRGEEKKEEKKGRLARKSRERERCGIMIEGWNRKKSEESTGTHWKKNQRKTGRKSKREIVLLQLNVLESGAPLCCVSNEQKCVC